MKTLKYILISKDSGQRVELTNAPVGWDDQKVSIIWDLTYFGLLKSLSVEFEFVGDGYTFIKQQKLSYGIDADVILRMYSDKNEFRFEGKVNFENFIDDRTGNRIKVDLLQSSLVQDFQNRESIKLNSLNNISLDRQAIDPASPIQALFRGKEIEFYSNFGRLPQQTDPDEEPDEPEPEHYHHLVPFLIIENGNPEVEEVSNFELTDDVPSLYHVENAIIQNNESGIAQTVNLKGSIAYTVLGMETSFPFLATYENYDGQPLRIRTRLLRINSDNVVLATPFVLETPVPKLSLPNITASKDFDITQVLQPGDYLIWVTDWYFIFEGGLNLFRDIEFNATYNNLFIKYTELRLEIIQASIFPNSVHPVILPYEYFSNLVAQMTGKASSFRSPFFGRVDLGYEEDGEGAYVGLVKGDWLRGVPLEETQLSSSFKEGFKSYDSLFSLGVSIVDNLITIDTKNNILNNEVVLELGEVSKLEIKPGKNFLFNSVLAGFPSAEYEKENGRDEFNTEVQYTNSVRSVKKEHNMKSVFRGDGYGIEFARREAIKLTGSKDSRYDNIIFLVDLYKDEEEGLMTRRLEDILYVEGVFSPETVINARLSPGQSVIRWGNYLKIPLYKKPSEYYFQSKEKNSGLRMATVIGESIDGADITINAPPYFLPDEHSFIRAVSLTDLITLLRNPNGLVTYTHRGEKFFDFLFEINAESDGGNSEWKTLPTKTSPIARTSEPLVAGLKYDNGFEDFVNYDDQPRDTILVE